MASKTIEEVLAEIDEALYGTPDVPLDNEVAVAPTQHGIVPPPRPKFDMTPVGSLPPYFTQTQLLRHRKWKKSEITEFLGDPDIVKTTRSYYTCYLYTTDRVLAVEREAQWRSVSTRPSQVPLEPWDSEISEGFYRSKDLTDRGWYRADIKMFLGEPHRRGSNSAGWAVKLYKIATVKRVEATEGWVYRAAAVAPLLYQQGVSMHRISELLSLTKSETLNYTKEMRESIREGYIQRETPHDKNIKCP